MLYAGEIPNRKPGVDGHDRRGAFHSCQRSKGISFVGSELFKIIAVERGFQLAIVMPLAIASAIARSGNESGPSHAQHRNGSLVWSVTQAPPRTWGNLHPCLKDGPPLLGG